tara:strand:- start:216 stop:377 length:162 start_codon:yes stop_codon:yes gene_type:complete
MYPNLGQKNFILFTEPMALSLEIILIDSIFYSAKTTKNNNDLAWHVFCATSEK